METTDEVLRGEIDEMLKAERTKKGRGICAMRCVVCSSICVTLCSERWEWEEVNEILQRSQNYS